MNKLSLPPFCISLSKCAYPIIMGFLIVHQYSIAQPLVQKFESAGNYNWTCPAGVTSVDVECWGGGGGGGGSSSTGNGGSGGGSGAYVKKMAIPVTPCSTYLVVVGIGGFSGSGFVTSVSAGEGGKSFFINSLTVSANGGCGGLGNRGSAGLGGCSNGSVAGCININDCVPSFTDNLTNFFTQGNAGWSGSTNRGGNGGSAPNGGIGGSGTTGMGQSGKRPGGGGGGGYYNFIQNDGGFGAAGAVYIYYTPSGAGPVGGTMAGPNEFCINATNIDFSYNQGTTAADSWVWSVPQGASINSGQGSSSINVNWGNTSGEVTVTPYLNGNAGCPITRLVTAVALPKGPTLLSKSPDAFNFVQGQGVSATFYEGTSGVNCVDEFTVSIDGENPVNYNPGDVVGANATTNIVIEGRRTCSPAGGCTDTEFQTLALWVAGSPTAISTEQEINSFFSIQPNPSSDMVNLKFKAGFVPTGIQLFDALGRLMDAQSRTSINVRDLPNGVYHIAVTSKEGRFTKSFVVAH